MPRYKPKKTKLIHEAWNKKMRALVAGFGGWDGERFVAVSSYADFRNTLVKNGVEARACDVFVDAFTAAVEAGQFDRFNWFHAFEKMSDWKRLGSALIRGGPRWINERNRRAFGEVFEGISMLEGDEVPSYPSHLADLGMTLESRIDWPAVKKQAIDVTNFATTSPPLPSSARLEVPRKTKKHLAKKEQSRRRRKELSLDKATATTLAL